MPLYLSLDQMLAKKLLTYLALTLAISSGAAQASNIIRMSAPIKGYAENAEPPPHIEPSIPDEPSEPENQGVKSRYWRLLFTSNNGSGLNFVGVQEIELRSAPGGPDLTSPSTLATASSYYPGDGLTPGKAVDNNYSDYQHAFWLSAQAAPFPHWLALDMGTSVEIREIALWPQNWAGGGLQRAPKDFEIQTSDDGYGWRTVRSVTGLTSWVLGQPSVISIE